MENCANTVKKMTISKNPVADYAIVCDKSIDFVWASAEKLRGVIADKAGVSLEITDTPVETAKKIVLRVDTDSEKPTYSVKTEGDDLILSGTDAARLSESVSYILRKYFGYRLFLFSGDFLELPSEIAIECENTSVAYNKVEKLTVEGRDISELVIVHNEPERPSVVFAAEEMKKYIFRATGVSLDIKVGEVSNDTPAIRLVFKEEMVESFSLKTDARGLTVEGGKRGVLYGVYKILDKHIGWAFLPARARLMNETDIIDISGLDYKYDQYFEYRAPFWCASSYNNYAAQNMVNCNNARRDKGEQYGGWYGITGRPFHTFAELLGDSSNQGSIGKNPCMADEDIFNRMVEGAKKLLRANPDAEIISVSANDAGLCQCEKCRGLDIGGNATDGLLRFVNRISDALADEFPHVKLHTLAYGATQEVPLVIKPRDNIIVQLCAIRCCYQHPLDEECCQANEELMYDLKSWAEVTKNIYVWDYTCDNFYYYATFPNFDVLKRNIQTFQKYNVRGIFCHGNAHHVHGEFGDLRAYLLAKLMENPYISDEEYDGLINRFMRGYYGPGWRYIRAYFDFLMESSAKMGHYGIYAKPEAMYCADDFISREAEVSSWFDKAEAEATDDCELVQIGTLRNSYCYLKLFFTYDPIIERGNEEEIEALHRECEETFEGMVREKIRLCDVHPPLGDVERDFGVKRRVHPRKWAPTEHRRDDLAYHGMPGSDENCRRINRSVTGDVIYAFENRKMKEKNKK